MRRQTAIVLAAVLAMTSGCSGFTNFQNSFSLPSPPITDNKTALDSWATRLDTLRDGLRQYDLDRTSTSISLMESSSGIAAAKTLVIDRNTYPGVLEGYVRARQDQIDGLCSIFFNSLQNLSSTSRWGRDQVNAVAEFGSLMLGLGGAATKQLATLSGMQVLFNDSYDAASAALLISADPYRVHRAVTTEQETYAQTSWAPPVTDFREAEAFVRGYAEPCTLMGVQRLISEALDIQNRSATGGGSQLAIRLSGLASTLNTGSAENASPIEREALTAEALAVLYWLLKLEPDPAERDAALSSLPASMKARVMALTTDGSSLRPSLETQIDAIDQLSPDVGRAARTAQAAYRESRRAEAASEDAAEVEVGNATTGAPPGERVADADEGAGAAEEPDPAEADEETPT